MKAINHSLELPPTEGAEWNVARQSNAADLRVERGWIQSRPYDLTLFTLSPLAGLLVILAANGSPTGGLLGLLATYLIAIPHYVSSFSFYLGDENLAYYRTRRLAFFAGPFLILLAVLGLRLFKFDAIVQSSLYVWNVYHVSLQSAGILSIYRRLNGGGFAERPFAHASILGVNSTMAFWHVERFAPLYGLLQTIHFPFWAIRPFLLTVSVAALLFYGIHVMRRPRPLSGAEFGLLVSALLFFHPYLWVTDSNLATLGMLMGHFIQYLGIIWLVNRRKYATAGGSEHQRVLSRLSGSFPLLLLSFAAVGFVFYVVQHGSAWIGIPLAYIVLWNSLTLVHFYLDGLVWAFKNPFVRKSLGPYLTPASRVVVS
jgi:hypothetical protein